MYNIAYALFLHESQKAGTPPFPSFVVAAGGGAGSAKQVAAGLKRLCVKCRTACPSSLTNRQSRLCTLQKIKMHFFFFLMSKAGLSLSQVLREHTVFLFCWESQARRWVCRAACDQPCTRRVAACPRPAAQDISWRRREPWLRRWDGLTCLH